MIPHEHGGWAMVSVPFLLGMMAGVPHWMHLLLFLAWLFLYLASYPFLQALKRATNRRGWIMWGVGYGSIAIICLIAPLFSKPELLLFGPLLLALLLINIGHAIRRTERAIINDLCAILLFSLGGAAAYLLGGGGWDYTMAVVVGFSFLHFASSAFFVKTVFRERNNKRWALYARIYHIVLLVIPWTMGYPLMIFSYVYSVVRAYLLVGKQIRPWKVGIIEIVSTVQFLLLAVYFIRIAY
jgi:hypothetical protein